MGESSFTESEELSTFGTEGLTVSLLSVFKEKCCNFLHEIRVGIVLQILQLKELLLIKVLLQHFIKQTVNQEK